MQTMENLNGLQVPMYEPSQGLQETVAANLRLYATVWRTDPRVTKGFTKRGYSGNGIDSQQQRKMATAIFGPKGIGWGVKDATFQVHNTQYAEHCTYRAVFWYKLPDSQEWGPWAGFNGSFDIAASLPLWQLSKKTNEWAFIGDYAKILATDALTKAFSELGFNADVFEGHFDNPAYLHDMQTYFSQAYPSVVDKRSDQDKYKAKDPATPPNVPPNPGKTTPKTFKYSGNNIDRARELFRKGQTPDAVLSRLRGQLGYVVPEAEELRLRSDYDAEFMEQPPV